jgi:uncharacterized membrane protein HdeD (DUF308 family)
MSNPIANFFNKHKGARRLTLVWACWLISVVVLRVTQPEVLDKISAPVASVVAGVIGILATVIAFYQTSRHKEENKNADLDS